MPRFYVCALTELIIANRDYVLAVARIHCRGDSQAAEDIAQIVMMKAIFTPNPLNDHSKIKGWLSVITRNTAINYFRAVPDFEYIENYDGIETNAEPVRERDERMDEVKKRFADLSPIQRQAMEMRVCDEKSFAEISNKMGVTYNTAKANYRHGMVKIRNSMRKQRR